MHQGNESKSQLTAAYGELLSWGGCVPSQMCVYASQAALHYQQ